MALNSVARLASIKVSYGNELNQHTPELTMNPVYLSLWDQKKLKNRVFKAFQSTEAKPAPPTGDPKQDFIDTVAVDELIGGVWERFLNRQVPSFSPAELDQTIADLVDLIAGE